MFLITWPSIESISLISSILIQRFLANVLQKLRSVCTPGSGQKPVTTLAIGMNFGEACARRLQFGPVKSWNALAISQASLALCMESFETPICTKHRPESHISGSVFKRSHRQAVPLDVW